MVISIKQIGDTNPTIDLRVYSLHQSWSSQNNMTKTTKNEHLNLDQTSVQTGQRHSCPEKCAKMG